MAFPALLDACVLLPYPLCDLLLRLADAGTYRPMWSDEILVEVERNLVDRFGVSPDKADSRVAMMRAVFPDAAVSGYQGIVGSMTNDPKDRHVLAAAVRGGAAVLVTANLTDFPQTSFAAFDLEVIHPDSFLLNQLDLYPERRGDAFTNSAPPTPAPP